MWQAVISAVGGLFTSWIDLKKEKHKAEAARAQRLAQAEADWDLEALRAAQYSWKDEMIAIIWYSPLVVGWYNPDHDRLSTAEEWISFVGGLPLWWQFGAFGIMAASFGLRWYFKQQGFKVGNKNGIN